MRAEDREKYWQEFGVSFDWYQATVELDYSAVVQAIQDRFSGMMDVQNVKPLFGYQNAVRMTLGSFYDVLVMWGLSGNSVDTFIQFTSANAIWGADFVKDLGCPFRVSRADGALDLENAGVWDEIYSLAVGIADEHGLRIYQAGDYHRGIDGRTLYLGSPKSELQVRIYEKGKQPENRGLGKENWVRIEVVSRPSSRNKSRIAALEPHELFGCSKWSRALYQRITSRSIPRVNTIGWSRKDSDLDIKVENMLRQYGKLILSLRDSYGADGAFQYISDVMASIKNRK